MIEENDDRDDDDKSDDDDDCMKDGIIYLCNADDNDVIIRYGYDHVIINNNNIH